MAQEDSIVSGMAGRYALALFSLAQERNEAEAVARDLEGFRAMLDESPDLRRLVRSPAFSTQEQRRALDAVLARARIGGLTANFFKLLVSKRRLFAVSEMIAGYRALLDRANGVAHAHVVVAEPLSAQHRQTLEKALREASRSRSVAVTVKVDPTILGGMIVRLGSRMIDSSLSTKLNSIRTRMKEVG